MKLVLDEFQRLNELLKSKDVHSLDYSIFQHPPKGRVEDRLAVYRDGYWLRLKEILEKSFPATRSFFGEERWKELGIFYIATEFKELDRNLSFIGKFFPAFLRSNGSGDFGASLAELEWKIIECSEAKDESAGNPEKLLGRIDEESTFYLNPIFSIFDSQSPIVTYWGTREERASSKEFCFIFRKQFQVQVFPIGEQEHAFLGSLGSGQKLGLAAEIHELDVRQIESFFVGRFLSHQILLRD